MHATDVDVPSTMRELDVADLLDQLVPEGPRLAVALLDDDVAASAPRFRSLLLQHALEALRRPTRPASKVWT